MGAVSTANPRIWKRNETHRGSEWVKYSPKWIHPYLLQKGYTRCHPLEKIYLLPPFRKGGIRGDLKKLNLINDAFLQQKSKTIIEKPENKYDRC
jgi:hypothetical protein